MALLSINARADQIVIGVGLNLLALGVTTFIFREVFAGQPEAHLARPEPIALPILSRIPVIGSALFDQTLLVYLAFAGVAVVWFVLQRTHAGLAIRAAGEVPAAADTAGVRVEGVRWAGTLIAGSMAGLAGAFLSVGQLGFFIEGMSAGRGFLALAAVIFGGWRALGVLGACLVFGAADALQLRLQAEETVPPEVWLALAIVTVAYLLLTARRRRGQGRRGPLGLVLGLAIAALGVALFALAPAWHFPSQLWLSQPYVLALIALAGFEGRARMPSAIAVPYRRGGGD
ncbi:MAG: ABC transporter permease [Actinomycetota bacterium]